MRYVLLQTALPDYRQACLDEMIRRAPELTVLVGSSHFEPSVVTAVNLGDRMRLVRNVYLLKRRMLFQVGMWRDVIWAEGLIVDGNPRILSTWIILVLRRVIGRRTSMWMHAWPRAGKGARSDLVRNQLRRLADVIVVYTETQKRELAERMPGKRIVAAPNALYRASQMEDVRSGGERDAFIYVGRLVPSKKPELLIEAFIRAKPRLPSSSRLIIVGAGPLEDELKQRANAGNVSESIEFAGHIGDPVTLKGLYSRSIASVSPGYVGLSITQSFGFGVPMIVSRDEDHAPEIEAAVEGVNAMFFKTDDAGALSDKLVAMWRCRDEWAKRGAAIVEWCKATYSAEVMAERLLSSLTST